jgi:hypothetical protein
VADLHHAKALVAVGPLTPLASDAVMLEPPPPPPPKPPRTAAAPTAAARPRRGRRGHRGRTPGPARAGRRTIRAKHPIVWGLARGATDATHAWESQYTSGQVASGC